MNINLMSMTELDRVVRNAAVDLIFRRKCLRELYRREAPKMNHTRGTIFNYYAPGL